MRKKAQSMPLNSIIIAIIVVVVLVILILVFTGRIGIFSKEAGNCESQGGQCVANVDTCANLPGVVKTTATCTDTTKSTCCMPDLT